MKKQRKSIEEIKTELADKIEELIEAVCVSILEISK